MLLIAQHQTIEIMPTNIQAEREIAKEIDTNNITAKTEVSIQTDRLRQGWEWWSWINCRRQQVLLQEVNMESFNARHLRQRQLLPL